MMRSMSLAIAALRNHQTFMDVVASNVANVNTTGYKSSRVSFQEMLSQTLRGSSAPTEQLGGLNAIQVGLGMTLGGIDTLFTQGSMAETGKLTDMAIQGDGFFVLSNVDGFLYTRDGNFDVDLDGSLVSLATGLKVMGWAADENGDVDTAGALSAIEIPYGQTMARATTSMTLTGNLDAEAEIGATAVSSIGVYDSLGILHTIDITYTKEDANEWSWAASDSDPDIAISGSGTIEYDSDGTYSVTNPAISLSMTCTNGAASSTITVDLTGSTQLEGTSSLSASSQNGLPTGSLTTFSVGTTGEITGVFSNGLNRCLGQIALASFTNSGGLLKVGQSLYSSSANSGTAQVGLPGEDGRGGISSGYLEASNVELAKEFTNMIVAQRGFQANSRVITTSDSMLEELVNLKR